MKNILQILSFSLLIVLSACTEDASIAGSFNESQSGTSGSITRFAILNDFMYTLNPNQLQTFDIRHLCLFHGENCSEYLRNGEYTKRLTSI